MCPRVRAHQVEHDSQKATLDTTNQLMLGRQRVGHCLRDLHVGGGFACQHIRVCIANGVKWDDVIRQKILRMLQGMGLDPMNRNGEPLELAQSGTPIKKISMRAIGAVLHELPTGLRRIRVDFQLSPRADEEQENKDSENLCPGDRLDEARERK